MAIKPKFDFDKKFQTKLLRAMYQFPDESRDIIEHLDPEHFDTIPMRWVARKMRWAASKLKTPLTPTVLEFEAVRDVRRGIIKTEHVSVFARFIANLEKKVPEKSFLLDKAHEFARYTALREFALKTVDKLQGDPSEFNWREMDRMLDEQRRFGERLDGDLGQSLFENIEVRLSRRRCFERNGVPTGIDAVDERMRHGGLPPRQMGVIVAPSNRGKTAALSYLSGSALRAGKRVLFITLELEEDMIFERLEARFTGLQLNCLSDRPKTIKKTLIAEQKKYGGELRVKYFPPNYLTTDRLASFLSRLETLPFYPDIIFIDYADNMSLREFGGEFNDNDYSPLGRLYVALRGMAGERNFALWTASQTNRGALDKDIFGAQDIADSYRKIMVADFVLGIAQKEASVDQATASRLVNLIVMKNRNGPSGAALEMRFNPARVSFSKPNYHEVAQMTRERDKEAQKERAIKRARAKRKAA